MTVRRVVPDLPAEDPSAGPEFYADAQRRGYEIVHPLTDEPWGPRRFFVRDPNGIVVNVVGHH